MSLHHIFYLVGVLLPLSIDTLILGAALGLAGLPKKERNRTSLILASFEALAPIVGVFIGQGVGHLIGRFAGYTAAIVIGAAGFLMLKPGDEKEKEDQKLKLLARAHGLAIIDLGISISLDELAIGLSLGLLHISLLWVVVFLGIQAFVGAQIGLRLGVKLNESAREGAEKIAGAVLLLAALTLIILKLSGHQI